MCVGEQHSYPSKSQVGHPLSGETNAPRTIVSSGVTPRACAWHTTIRARPSTCNVRCRLYEVAAPRPGQAWNSSGIVQINYGSSTPLMWDPPVEAAPHCSPRGAALPCWFREETSHHTVKG